MPFVPSEKNLRKVITGQLAQGEMLTMLFGAGRRVFALTSNRLLCTNFPFFAKGKILSQGQLGALGKVDYLYPAAGHMTLVATGIDSGAPTKVPMQSMPMQEGDVYDLVVELVEKIHHMDPATRPSYLQDGEAILGTAFTSEGTVRATDRALYLLQPDASGNGAAVAWAAPYAQMTGFDYHEAGMGSVEFIAVSAGEAKSFKIGSTAVTRFQRCSSKDAPDWFPVLVRQTLDRIGAARPPYMEPDERTLMRLPVSTGLTGNLPNLTLSVTDRRLLELKSGSEGLLELHAAFSRNAVRGAKVTDVEGQNGGTVSYRLQLMVEDQPHEWKVGSRHKKDMDALLLELGYK